MQCSGITTRTSRVVAMMLGRLGTGFKRRVTCCRMLTSVRSMMCSLRRLVQRPGLNSTRSGIRKAGPMVRHRGSVKRRVRPVRHNLRVVETTRVRAVQPNHRISHGGPRRGATSRALHLVLRLPQELEQGRTLGIGQAMAVLTATGGRIGTRVTGQIAESGVSRGGVKATAGLIPPRQARPRHRIQHGHQIRLECRKQPVV